MSALRRSNEPLVHWPPEGVTRVPYRIFTDPEIYRLEEERIFKGPVWHFLCLEIEIPQPGDIRLAMIGETPIIVTRDERGAVNAMVNRCAHRGSLVCLKERDHQKALTCAYHSWSYDLEGRLLSVAFRRGVRGRGGMPEDFDISQHRLQKLRVETFCGLVFGTFSEATPPVEDYLGPMTSGLIRRALGQPYRLLGVHSQMLHNNWKLYAENVRDSYHASLLHTFYTAFKINRVDMDGGMLLSEDGRHSVSYSKRATLEASEELERMRSAQSASGLEGPQLLDALRRVAGRHHACDPGNLSDIGRAVHVELDRGALLRAARARRDRAVLDLSRARGGRGGTDRNARDSGEPHRRRRARLARGRLHQRVRAARHARQPG
jgi:phenylpropionate dioxygenase-like ring-hydroxylating dioxygenase large terminal subunit